MVKTKTPFFTPIVLDGNPLVGFTRLGILFQPVCVSDAKHPIVILEFDPTLRDYILLSQIFPSQLPPVPPSPATWSVTNLQDPTASGNIDLSITLPDDPGPIHCHTTQEGADLFLGVDSPEEFDVSLSLSGTVLGSIYVDFPIPLPPPPPLHLPPSPPHHLPPPPPPPLLPPALIDPTFPPDFEYPPEFLWPSQVYTFYPWYYIMYGNDSLPPLEMLPCIPTTLK